MNKINNEKLSSVFCSVLNWLKSNRGFFILSLISIALIVFFVYCIWECIYLDNEDDFEYLYYLLMATFTLIITWVAYVQLHAIRETNKTALLIKINEDWNSHTILKSRIELCKLKNKNKDITIGHQLIKMRDDLKNGNIKEDEKIESYIRIKSLLDYFEGICLLVVRNHLTIEDVNDSMGSLIISYYKDFREFLEEKDDNFYCEIENVYHKLKKLRNK